MSSGYPDSTMRFREFLTAIDITPLVLSTRLIKAFACSNVTPFSDSIGVFSPFPLISNIRASRSAAAPIMYAIAISSAIWFCAFCHDPVFIRASTIFAAIMP